MYFIASGAVEVQVDPAPVRLGSGDFFGEIALLVNRRRTANVVTLGYCQLLVLYVRDFRRLLRADPALRRRIDRVARRRLGEAPALDDPDADPAQEAEASRFSNTSLPSPGA
jgi:CPA1 family monovalent cation:H+ antiporter